MFLYLKKLKDKFSRWFDDSLKNLIKEKRLAHNNYKINPC